MCVNCSIPLWRMRRAAALQSKCGIRREAGTPVGPVSQATCAMVALLAAAVVYLVVISNHVSSDRAHVGQLSTQLAAGSSRPTCP